jgi:2-iminobutanoate/2-iminopropanoate deaminase
MADQKIINTPDAPAAIGPYSQAVVHGGMVYTAGQIPLDPSTGEMVGEDVASQTRQVFKNLEAVLAAAGATFSDVVKTTVFLRSMDDFAAMNEVYAGYFGDSRPARSTVQAARLPRDSSVEIECIAIVSAGS